MSVSIENPGRHEHIPTTIDGQQVCMSCNQVLEEHNEIEREKLKWQGLRRSQRRQSRNGTG
jgi:hypothetical protein